MMKMKNALMFMGAGIMLGCTYEKYKKEMTKLMEDVERKAIKKTAKMVNNM